MPLSVAVVGAGIAGAAAARVLTEAGHTVRVFDKGRAPGGRTSTRWYDNTRQFDHGCASFTARSPAFMQAVEAWARAGVVVKVEGAQGTYTGTPGMGTIAAHLVRGLSVRCGVGPSGGEVWRVSRDGARWRLYGKQGEELPPGFDAVAVATPAPQAAQLLAFMPVLAERMRAVAMTPTWTLMAEFEGEAPAAGTGTSGVLSQVLLDSAKRPGPPRRNAWVAHATDAWTLEHLELEPEQVEPVMLAALREAVAGLDGTPTFMRAHRWRYARVTAPDSQPFALDADRPIGVCGDAFTSDDPDLDVRFGTVEAAYLSGVRLARELVGRLAGAAATPQ